MSARALAGVVLVSTLLLAGSGGGGGGGSPIVTLPTTTTTSSLTTFIAPAGTMTIWPGTGPAPEGWLICDGSAVSRATFAALFNAIGTTYGAGNGSTTFNLPDTRGRVIVGNHSSQAEFDTIGESGGERTHVLTVGEMPSHSHPGSTTDASKPSGANSGQGGSSFFQPDTVGSVTVASQGGGGAHNNLQPYLVMRMMIKT